MIPPQKKTIRRSRRRTWATSASNVRKPSSRLEPQSQDRILATPGKNWPGWCGGLLLVVWFFARQKVGEFDWIERYWKWFGWYGYTVTKKNTVPVLEPRRWKGAPVLQTVWAFTVIKHVGFYVTIPTSYSCDEILVFSQNNASILHIQSTFDIPYRIKCI